MTRFVRTLLALAVTTAVAGCGLPKDGTPRPIDAEDVPYNLITDPGPTSEPSIPDAGRPAEPELFWVTAEDTLVPSDSAATCTDDLETLVSDLLDELEAGPSEPTRHGGLATALAPDTDLELAGLTTDTVAVDLEPGSGVGAERLPLGVAQIVLTVTSVPGIDQVRLLHQGDPLQVPLPGGALTSSALAAADYDDLVPLRYRSSLRRDGAPSGLGRCGGPSS